jgi:hypothetical protein
MGSAITFTDKITNKNCQNLQDLKEPLCNHNNHCISRDHVEIQQDYDDEVEAEADTETGTELEGLAPCCPKQKKLTKKRRYEQQEYPEVHQNNPHRHVHHQHQRVKKKSQHHLQQHDCENHHEDDEHEGQLEKGKESQRRSRCNSSSCSTSSTFQGNPTCGKLATIVSKLGKSVMGGRRCLCDTIKPILKLSQLLGVIPLRLHHQRNEEGEKIGYCELTFQWRSLSTILNTSFIMFFILITPFAHAEIRDRMKIVFSGTDLYAFTLQTMAMVLETTILLTVGRLYKGKFSKVRVIYFKAGVEID